MEQEQDLTLAELTQNISDKLLDSIYIVELLDEIIEPNAKIEILTKQLKEKIKDAFEKTEQCRQKIYIPSRF